MKFKKLIGGVVVTSALVLTACGGSDSSGGTADTDLSTTLQYSYPIQQQAEVPTSAPVVLRFSQSITDTDVADSITLRQGGESGVEVDTTLRQADQGRSLILTPTSRLDPNGDYVVVIEGSTTVENRTIAFATRALREGPISLTQSNPAALTLVRVIPDGSAQQPMIDFSTLRLQFSQPLDLASVRYGQGEEDTLALVDTTDSTLVPARVLVDGPYLTIDPNEELTAGREYQLEFQNQEVASVTGDTFAYEASSRFRFQPVSSLAEGTDPAQRPLPLVQRITTPEDLQNDDDAHNDDGLSTLTGEPVNTIPVSAVLLGDESTTYRAVTQQQGDVVGELAYPPSFPDVTPLRLRRGNLLHGSEIDVKIGGEVEAGFDSGAVTVEFLSDATGYLTPNPYDPNGPRLVRLYMDAALSTEDPIANAGVTQSITHIELIGTATADTQAGVLDINAVGVVEPKILGRERGHGTLSFQLQTYRDQTEERVEQALAAMEPAPLALLSWSHGGSAEQRPTPGQPIVLYFNRPVDDDTLQSVTLIENTPAAATPVPTSVHRDGAALIVRPEQPLRRPRVENGLLDEVSYELSVGGEINLTETVRFDDYLADVDDWRWANFEDGELTYKDAEEDQGMDTEQIVKRAPALLMSYPGFPCAVDASTRDIANNIAGRCEGALRDQYTNVTEDRVAPPDDLLPIQTLPANDSIAVHVTRDIDADSVVLGQTFLVEELTEQGDYVGDVDGHISVRGARITFTPATPWTPGTLYRYVVKSNGDDLVAVNETSCDGTQAVCGVEGMPLQTKLYDVDVSEDAAGRLVQTPAQGQAGGPDLQVLFRGGDATGHVWLPLAGTSKDTNANFLLDRSSVLPPLPEEGDHPSSLLITNFRDYSGEEEGVDPNNLVVDPLPQDPGGIKPVPNSAKLLSNTPWVPGSAFPGPQVNGLVVGCGYQYGGETDMQPRVCPEDKFTYLHSALASKVTDEYVEGKGIKVLVWPGQIIGSSVNVTALTLNAIGIEMDSGLQLMRMRYAKDDPQCEDTLLAPCPRSQPLEGYISDGPDGPEMAIDVDLYIDAAALTDGISFIGLGSTLFHNLVSLPVSLSLKGDVTFQDDGRIVVNQISQNALELDFKIESDFSVFENAGTFQLLVPEEGAFLRYRGDLPK